MDSKNCSPFTIWCIPKINIILRLSAISLLFFIDPIIAIAINMFLDAIDGPIYEHYLGIDGTQYQLQDKFLDLAYYIGLFVLVLNLQLPATPMLVFLFGYRLVGQLIFFYTKKREIIVYFPNLFEYFVLSFLVLGAIKEHHLWPQFDLTYPLLFCVTVGKIIHEITLHRYKQTIFLTVVRPAYRWFKSKLPTNALSTEESSQI